MTEETVPTAACPCCGAQARTYHPVLWRELIEEWGLSAEETAYIDRQQGVRCANCGSSLRSMALAQAIMSNFRFTGSLAAFVATVNMQHIHVLEINEAGNLTAFLSQVPHYTLAMYPAVDMQRLPYPDQSFDLIVHSDTLEHVADPMTALAECRRVLRPQGICAFTIPTIVGRLTRSRTGLPPSYHGAPGIGRDDYIVHTEYGADAWTQVIMAGFTECRIVTLEYPAGIALVAA